MYRYAQINTDTGMIVGDSWLSGEVNHPNLIAIPDDFDITGKRYANGEWVDYTPEPVAPEPTEQERVSAEILLNQAEILSNQSATDEVLAEILLNQMGG